LLSAIIVMANRDSEPPTFFPREQPGARSAAQDLTCAPGEKILSSHTDFVDGPGGSQTPDDAMEAWLRSNSYRLTLADVVQVDHGGSNPEYAEYEYRKEAGQTIAKFPVSYIGDSWHVDFWEACADQGAAIIRMDDTAPE
jgi:hypothetical protein